MGQFLSQARSSPTNDYAVLQDRSLDEDLQVALVVLGGEPAALANIPVRDAVQRERYGLMRVGLHQKLHPEAWEQNLQMLAECRTTLQAMPPTRDRARLTRNLASFGFRTGERLCAEAAGIPPEDALRITTKRAVASRYFQAARATQRQLATEKWSRSRTSPTDMALLWVAAFNSYYCERDYDNLMAATTAQLTNSAPGSPNWLAAKLYQGVALAHQTPPQPEMAARAFEELFSYGFRGVERNAAHDHLLLSAARWRIRLALNAGDPTTALRLVQWVEQGNCARDLKRKFLKDHAWVAKWAAAEAK